MMLNESYKSVPVIIADDHELARAGLRAILSNETWIEIVGEAENGREAVELCRRLQPQLVLLDVRMPELNGLAATRTIKQEFPQIHVIIMTMYENTDYLQEAIKAGAAGYVLKDASRQEVVQAVRQVLDGESFLNGALTARLIQRLTVPTQHDAHQIERLTPRELEVLGLLTQGLTNREIAHELVISPGTAKIHVERIIAKLGVADRTQAAVRAVELGLVQSSLT
ncbi:MAG: response regulator transcription factor [Chloroflexales bacterium]|nr:response regulator transcription factor [Chloroflexales bacterium]